MRRIRRAQMPLQSLSRPPKSGLLKIRKPPEKRLPLMTFGELGRGDSKFPVLSSASERGLTFCAA